MAWFLRGAQSAFFYYVSCAPCTNYAFERKRSKQKAKADKETRELMKLASRHTNGQIIIPGDIEGATQERFIGMGAFTTNIYWAEDMMMGPQPKRGKNRRNTFDGLDNGDGKENKKGKGRGKETNSVSAKKTRAATVGSLESVGASSLDTIRPGTSRESESDKARAPLRPIENRDTSLRGRYQRPDETLWGYPEVEKDWEFYARGRNPCINSLCPPAVSTKPARPSQAQWMLQPPPPAKVMEGKVAPTTRRSSAGESSWQNAARKRSGGNATRDFMHRPEKAHLCELGERMTDLGEPVKSKWRQQRMYDGTDDYDYDTDFGSLSPGSPGHTNDESDMLTHWRNTSKSFSRERRPSPIVTMGQFSSKTSSKPNTSKDNLGRDKTGFNPSWKFPRSRDENADRDPLSDSTPVNAPRIDGYYSEPEPSLTAGYSFQDFATSPLMGQGSSVITEEKFETPRSPESRPQSDSTTSQTRSAQSSKSSLPPTEGLLAQDVHLASKEANPADRATKAATKPTLSTTSNELRLANSNTA